MGLLTQTHRKLSYTPNWRSQEAPDVTIMKGDIVTHRRASSIAKAAQMFKAKADKRRDETFKQVVKDLAETSSVHGIPKIASTPQLPVKILWSLLFVATFSVYMIQLTSLFQAYYERKIQTKIELDFSSLPFPAITVCNMNPVKKSKIFSTELYTLLKNESAKSIEDMIGRRHRRDTKRSQSQRERKQSQHQMTDDETKPSHRRDDLYRQGQRIREPPDGDQKRSRVPLRNVRRRVKRGGTNSNTPGTTSSSTDTSTDGTTTYSESTITSTVSTESSTFSTSSSPSSTESSSTPISRSSQSTETSTSHVTPASFSNTASTETQGPSSAQSTTTQSPNGASALPSSTTNYPYYGSGSGSGSGMGSEYWSEYESGSGSGYGSGYGSSYYDSSYYSSGSGSSAYYSDSYWYEWESWYNNMYSGSAYSDGTYWDSDSWSQSQATNDYYATNIFARRDEHDEFLSKWQYVYKNIDEEERDNIGHQMEDLFQSITYIGTIQNITEMEMTTSATYGNCYTISERKFMAWRSGPNFGIRLTLNLEMEEYIGEVTNGYGVRIVFHEPGTHPLPEEEGITLGPGTETSIGLRLVRISRLDRPYGECIEDTFFKKQYGRRYTIAACDSFCRIHQTVRDCQCIPVEAPDNMQFNRTVLPFCNSANKTHQLCQVRVDVKFNTGEYECGCKGPCSETVYQKTLSSRTWPNEEYLGILVEEMCKKTNRVDGVCMPDLDEHSFDYAVERYKNNFARVVIYFEDLNYERITQEPLYEFVRFLSDIGGATGLFLGASVLSVVELLQLIMEVFLYLKRRANANRKTIRVRALPEQ